MIRKPTQTSNESGIQEHIGVYWPDGDKYAVKIPARYRQYTEHLKSTEFHLTPGELSQALNIKASAAKTACYRLSGEQKIEKEDGKQKFYYDKKKK